MSGEKDWIHSLERDMEIIRDQISLARAVGAESVAVPVDRLERLLAEIENLENQNDANST